MNDQDAGKNDGIVISANPNTIASDNYDNGRISPSQEELRLSSLRLEEGRDAGL